MTNRYRAIDCLRGLAAFWVVLFHLWIHYYPGMNTQEHRFYPPRGGGDFLFWVSYFLIQYGYTGVTLFFVLSGFCIHLPFAGGKPFQLGDFYRRRFWRLYPAYIVSIIFVIACLGVRIKIYSVVEQLPPVETLLIMEPEPSRPAPPPEATQQPKSNFQLLKISDAVVNALFLQNFQPSSVNFNPVYWTLLYEVQFYLLYPLLFWLTRRLGPWPVLAVCLLIELTLAYFPIEPVGTRTWCVNGIFEWYLGAFLAEMWVRGRRVSLTTGLVCTGILGVIFGFVTFNVQLWAIKDMVAAVAFGCLLMTLLSVSNRPDPPVIATSAGWNPLVFVLAWLGMVSYSLYLTHLPLMEVMWALRVYPVLPYLSVLASLVVAWVFYRVFELPFMVTSSKPKAKA